MAELLRARIVFSAINPDDIVQRNRDLRQITPANETALLITRVAFIIPRVARRVPWRSDCLVQTIAAQNWLAAYGIASEIAVGVKKPSPEDLAAHAWLTVDNRVVIGGETRSYRSILP